MILETIDELTVDELRAQGAQSAGKQPQPLDVSRFNVPDWARWIAMDANGEVWAYMHKPSPCAYRWEGGVEVKCLGYNTPAYLDWRQTLTPVNQAVQEPATDEHIANAVATVGQLSPDDLATFAKQLVAADAAQCDRLIDALITALELEPDNGRHGRIAAKVATVQRGAAFVEAERRKLAVRTFADALRDRIDADIEALLRVAQ